MCWLVAFRCCVHTHRQTQTTKHAQQATHHELHELDVVGRLPPLAPARRVAGRDADVADRRVVPHVEDLLLFWSFWWFGGVFIKAGSRLQLHDTELTKPRNKQSTQSKTPPLTLSSYPASGTGMPHFKSRVMQRGLRPFFVVYFVVCVCVWVCGWGGGG